METLIKSRQRVQQFGEVFTPRWMVQKMLALPDIQPALRDPTTNFLEPCCGEGAFLTEILRLKLSFNPDAHFDALRSLYGIEIQLDNLAYARRNLAEIFADFYQLDLDDLRIWDILNRNIFHGDVLKFEIPTLFEEVTELSQNPLADALKAHFNLSDEEIKRMIIISNPPYHEENSSNNRDQPVYHKFLTEYHNTSDRVMVIHPARCLFDAGATPKDFNEKLLSDEHVKVAVYHSNSKEVFPNLDIKGGVAATYRDANENFGAIGTYIPIDKLKSIHHKVTSRKDFRPLNEIMYTSITYKLSKKFFSERPDLVPKLLPNDNALRTNIFEKLAEIFYDEKPDDGYEYAEIYGMQNNRRIFKFFRADFIDDNVNFRKYKVFIPKAYGSGAIYENGPTMLVGSPLVGATQTFMTLGAFDTGAEATAAMNFVKTKFARALLGILKVTQDASLSTWRFVPMQNFTPASDIDWSASVADIDRQLYAKYGLDEREIGFIEAKVKAMD